MKKSIIDFCPHCCNKVQLKVVFRHEYEPTMYSADTGEPTGNDGLTCEYLVCICTTCDELLVYHSFDNECPTLEFPNIGLDESIPKSVKNCYMEAKQIQAKAPNAFAVMIRKSLEALCDDREVKKGTLITRLKELANRGEIPPTLLELTNILRELGNVGAHYSDQQISVPMTWEMTNFFKTIVEYVYVAPSKLKKIREKFKK